jgi:hypothetical protein
VLTKAWVLLCALVSILAGASLPFLPLGAPKGAISLPMSFYANPGFLASQHGFSSGASLLYDAHAASYDFSAAGIRVYRSGGFGVGYANYAEEGIHAITASGATFGARTSGGLSLHLLFTDTASSFSFDAGAAFRLSDRYTLGVSLRNAMHTDTLLSRDPRFEVCGAAAFGNRFFIAPFAAVNAGMDSRWRSIADAGASAGLHARFFSSPALLSMLKIGFRHNLKDSTVLHAGFALGPHIEIKTISAGVMGGYYLSSAAQSSAFSVSMYYTQSPVRTTESPPLTYSLTLSADSVSPNGDGMNEQLLISIRASDRTTKAKPRKWSLCISTSSVPDKGVVRCYSGGGIPPSSIVWEARNAEEDIVEPGRYFVQFRGIDTFDRIFETPVYRVYVTD